MTNCIISFNIGAIYNIIVKWVGEGTQLSVQLIKQILSSHLSDVQNINLNKL